MKGVYRTQKKGQIVKGQNVWKKFVKDQDVK